MHNYLKKLNKLMESDTYKGKSGKYALLDVQHDGWCAIYNGGECNCDPDVSIMPDVSEETFITAMTRPPRAD